MKLKENISKSAVISSLFWKLMERGGTQGIQMIIQIVLARLLSPENFGTIAIILVFINLAQVFVESGLNTALIQKKDADDLDFSSVFYSSLIIAGILYLLIFAIAPGIAKFYDDSNLTRLLRVLALTLIPGAFNSVQNAYVSRNMLFKKLFYSSLGSIAISGAAGIVAALAGMGVWALVIQNLTNQIAVTVIMWFTVKWRPILKISFTRVKSLFFFGWKLLASGLLNSLSSNLRTLIVGRIYSPADLGYYNRGHQVPTALVNNFNGSIQAVMLPALSSIQDDKDNVKRVVRRSIKTSTFLIFPMMTGLAVVAESLIRVILGEQWLPAVPFLQMFCISSALLPIHTANLQAINAQGRSDIFLKLEVIKNILGLVVLFVSIPYGIYVIALGSIVSSFISAFINSWPNKNLFNYSPKEQIIDILPAAGISLVMGVLVFMINFIDLPSLLMLIIQILTGAVIYIVLAKLFKLESYSYIKITVKEIFAARRKRNDIV